MDKIQEQKLRRMLHVFKFAAEEEKKAQKMYLKYQNMFANDKEIGKIFKWLYCQELRHENKLRQKYIVFKRLFKIK